MNKLIGLTLLIVSFLAIEIVLSYGHGNWIAARVLNFACGYLAGYIIARR